jgi:hypothetical protein
MSDIRQIARQAADAEYRAWHRMETRTTEGTLLVDRVADAVAPPQTPEPPRCRYDNAVLEPIRRPAFVPPGSTKSFMAEWTCPTCKLLFEATDVSAPLAPAVEPPSFDDGISGRWAAESAPAPEAVEPEPTYTAGEIADPAFYRVQPAALPDIEALLKWTWVVHVKTQPDLAVDAIIKLRDALRAEATARQTLEQVVDAAAVLLEKERAARQQAEQERDAQYDQAVEATIRALQAEQELDDFKDETRERRNRNE